MIASATAQKALEARPIPAWGEAPGSITPDARGLKARHMVWLLPFCLAGCQHSSVEVKGKAATIHVETLGEYPTTIKSFQVAPVTAKEIPFFRIEGEDGFQTWAFTLHSGVNDIHSINTSHGSYRIISPAIGKEFTLSPQTRYIATVCEAGHYFCRTEIFSFDE